LALPTLVPPLVVMAGSTAPTSSSPILNRFAAHPIFEELEQRCSGCGGPR
jgi:hypothetical protein